MTIKLKNLDAGLGVVFKCEGTVTGQEIIGTNNYLLKRKDEITKSNYCIVDYSETDEFTVSNEELKIIADQDRIISKYRPDYTIAFVVKRELEFSASCLWEAITQTKGIQWETWVFKDRKKAERWIKEKVKEKHGIDLTMA